MKVTPFAPGPFSERPYFEDREIERIAIEELRAVDLLPPSPQPIRVDRFIEKRFSVTPIYETLPEGVLGYTWFGSGGVERVVVARSLGESGDKVDERRVNTTLAHEAGHGLLHAHLFVVDAFNRGLFNDDDAAPGKILCRDHDRGRESERRYDGRWWEVQANLLMGALLLPKPLVFACLKSMTKEQGSLGTVVLPPEQRRAAASALAEAFDVNPVVGRLRIDRLLPVSDSHQLTL